MIDKGRGSMYVCSSFGYGSGYNACFGTTYKAYQGSGYGDGHSRGRPDNIGLGSGRHTFVFVRAIPYNAVEGQAMTNLLAFFKN